MPPKKQTHDDEVIDDVLDESDVESVADDEEWDAEPVDDAPKKATAEDDEEEADDLDALADDDVGVVEYDDLDDQEDEAPSRDLIKTLKIVPAAERTTSERMSNFECARVLGERARHIDNNARPYIDVTNYTSSLEIAYNELLQKRIPMSVVRKVGGGRVEIWRVKEMIIPKLPPQEWFMVNVH
jgi:DNA-directed RNA polymerase subunit K/omega